MTTTTRSTQTEPRRPVPAALGVCVAFSGVANAGVTDTFTARFEVNRGRTRARHDNVQPGTGR